MWNCKVHVFVSVRADMCDFSTLTPPTAPVATSTPSPAESSWLGLGACYGPGLTSGKPLINSGDPKRQLPSGVSPFNPSIIIYN